ncbi:MAG: hypothetical protein KDD78_00835 [Caldilineaceae bacterium]|nr:hypothetical protein [Caldilineaceae bacterium]
MSAEDSSTLLDSPVAGKVGLNRAYLYSEDMDRFSIGQQPWIDGLLNWFGPLSQEECSLFASLALGVLAVLVILVIQILHWFWKGIVVPIVDLILWAIAVAIFSLAIVSMMGVILYLAGLAEVVYIADGVLQRWFGYNWIIVALAVLFASVMYLYPEKPAGETPDASTVPDKIDSWFDTTALTSAGVAAFFYVVLLLGVQWLLGTGAPENFQFGPSTYHLPDWLSVPAQYSHLPLQRPR